MNLIKFDKEPLERINELINYYREFTEELDTVLLKLYQKKEELLEQNYRTA